MCKMVYQWYTKCAQYTGSGAVTVQHMFVVDASYQAEHVVHIDNLLFLLHLAPYFNDDPNFKCCLPVATAHPLSLDEMLE